MVHQPTIRVSKERLEIVPYDGAHRDEGRSQKSNQFCFSFESLV
jgi:hypothetical protein